MTDRCRAKRPYATEEEARCAVRSILKTRNRKPGRDRAGFLRAYRCPDCGAWHVGHRKDETSLIRLIDRVIAADKAKKGAGQ